MRDSRNARVTQFLFFVLFLEPPPKFGYISTIRYFWEPDVKRWIFLLRNLNETQFAVLRERALAFIASVEEVGAKLFIQRLVFLNGD